MKISFATAALAEAARAIGRIPSASVKMDILDHARLEAGGGKMSLTMSDLDMEGNVILDCAGDGILAAIPRAVLDFFVLRAEAGDAEGMLEFTVRDGEAHDVTARAGRARLTMPVLRADAFPLLASFEPQWSFVIRAHELCAALRRIERAMLPGDPTFWKDGAFLHESEAGVSVISTDGSRLHIVDFDAPVLTGAMPPQRGRNGDDGVRGIILPGRAVKEVLRIFGDDESEITVAGNGNMATVSGASIRIASKLIDAPFFGGMDYRKVVPPRPQASIGVAGEHLARAIRSLLVVPKTEAKGKKASVRGISISVAGSTLVLRTRGDVGDSEEVVDAEPDGVDDGLRLHLDARHMTDAIDAVGAARVAIHPPEDLGKPFHVSGADGATILIGQRRPDRMSGE